MKLTTFRPLLCATALTVSLAACGDDSGGDTAANDSTGDTGVTTTADSTANNPPETDTDPVADSSTTEEATDTGDTGVEPIVYPDAPFEDYVRVDRAGMPAVNTVLITSKDDYNQASLTDDVDGMFVPEIVASLGALHSVLDDDIMALGAVPCAIDDCVAVGGPLILPDTLKVDIDLDAGFPNGRRLQDPVIDITLAVLMLDITNGTHTPVDLVGLLNPAANDVEFDAAFPYLVAPN